MNRIVFAFLLIAPGVLLADEPASVPCAQCVPGDCCDCRCAHCGCQTHCQKYCHVVCEWKDVKETIYGCRCKDICIPGRSEKECTKIDECNPYNCPIAHDYKPLYSIWNPSECARIRPVTKLVKYEVTHKVPVYKWVVEYCCPNCCNAMSSGVAQPGVQTAVATQLPTAPSQAIAQPIVNAITPQPQPIAVAQAPVEMPTPPQIVATPAISQPQPDVVAPRSIVELAGFNAPPATESAPPQTRPAYFEGPDLPPAQPELPRAK
jgi:hypothetical protein